MSRETVVCRIKIYRMQFCLGSGARKRDGMSRLKGAVDYLVLSNEGRGIESLLKCRTSNLLLADL